MSHVDIAMATYNGEAYIEEQLCSIINQTHTDWTLYISDDGSSDDTTNIIEKYVILDTRIKLINASKQGGVVRNFNKALEATIADYIMLSDQDDFWHERKIELLLNKMSEVENESTSPVLIFSDLELVDDKLVTISDSFYEANKINPLNNLDFNNLLWSSSVYGCSTIFNRKLLNKSLPFPSSLPMHDNWLALNSATESGIYYYDIQTIKYRQHGKNVVGGGHKNVFGKIKNFKKSFKNVSLAAEKYKSMLESAKKIKGNECLLNISLSGRKKIAFCFKNILPKVFYENKKILTFFMFLGIILK